MLLLVGLGNVGEKYRQTRHNLGFLFIDHLVEKYKLRKINNKLKSTLYKGSILNSEVILSKPTTMMNLSGNSVRLIKNFYKIYTEDIIIIHDFLLLIDNMVLYLTF